MRPDRVRRRLAELRTRGYNFDAASRHDHPAAAGWHVDDLRQVLPTESPGPPAAGGSWEIARRLMLGYEFADPSIVQADYDPNEPLEGRTMLLELRFHGLLRFHAGTRVRAVFDDERRLDARRARVWGWTYGTLEGHLEQGEMTWEVWKWLDSGDVEFRIHAYSRPAPDLNPILRLGFRLFGRREQLAFMHGTLRRMQGLTEAALHGAPMQRSADALTARGAADATRAHRRLARRLKTR